MARAAFYIDGFNLYHALDALEKPAMAWKCGKCQGPGEASAVWWDGERRAYEFSTGRLKTGSPPGVYD